MLDKSIYYLYIFILVFSILAFGTVELWSMAMMETTIFAALFLLSIRTFYQNKIPIHPAPGMVPLLLLILFHIIQTIPLPGNVLRLISPAAYEVFLETSGNPDLWASITLNKKGTLMETFRMVSYGAFYFLTVQILSQKGRIKDTLNILLSFMSLYAFFAIIQHSIPNGQIFWFRPAPHEGAIFGSYVNRNHYAGIMGMIFPLAVALFIANKPKIPHGSLLERARSLMLHRSTNTYILYGLASIVIALSIFLSLSRGGIVSLSSAMVFMGTLVAFRQRDMLRGATIIFLSIAILSIVGWFGWEPIFSRFNSIRTTSGDISELRLHIWDDTTNIIRDFFVTGTGFGSFGNIYPKYRTIHGDYVIDHAHNDYLEFMSNGGIVGVLLISSFLFSLSYKSYINFKARKNSYAIYLYIGAMTGIMAILLHSMTDFNLHIGANGLFFSFLLGLAVSSADTSFRTEDTNKSTIRGEKVYRGMVVFAATLLLIVIGFNGPMLLGNKYFQSSTNKQNKKLRPNELIFIEKTLKKAILFDPLEGKYPARMSALQVAKKDYEGALRYINEALKRTPSNGAFLQRRGIILSMLKQKEAAEKFMLTGIKYDPTNPERYLTASSWLIGEGRREEAAGYLKSTIMLEPGKTRNYLTFMVINKFSYKEMISSLPQKVEAHLQLADYLKESGKKEQAALVISSLQTFLNKDDDILPSHFIRIYTYYKHQKRYDEALKVTKTALQFFPADYMIRLITAEAYEQSGITYRALEEYKKVLFLNPDNMRARKRIEVLSGSR